jgi:hypothetical protein
MKKKLYDPVTEAVNAAKAANKKAKRKTEERRYFTHAHNIEMCLQNGSYVAKRPDGSLVQYMNGDYMGEIDTVPETMTEVPAALAKKLLPDCCK